MLAVVQRLKGVDCGMVFFCKGVSRLLHYVTEHSQSWLGVTGWAKGGGVIVS
jgi:hypothetical protein